MEPVVATQPLTAANPTLGKGVCCGAAAKMVAVTAATKQSWQPPWTDMLGSDLPCHRHRAPLIYFCCGHLRAAHSHEPIPCSNLPSAPLLSHTAHHVCQPFVARSARDKFPSYTPQPLRCRCAMRPPPRPKHPSILPWVSTDCPCNIRARL